MQAATAEADREPDSPSQKAKLPSAGRGRCVRWGHGQSEPPRALAGCKGGWQHREIPLLSSTAPRLDPCLPQPQPVDGDEWRWHRAHLASRWRWDTPLDWTTLTGQTPGRAGKARCLPPVHAVRGRCGAIFSPRRSQRPARSPVRVSWAPTAAPIAAGPDLGRVL
jgi:hypothetical protein